ncbi:response regulator [Haloferula chungangensis]|uniref:Response regulator n=1 Tax=Haloferula chungangensis TaxID=1048331 RepID=A0ABW2L7W8_9BACT
MDRTLKIMLVEDSRAFTRVVELALNEDPAIDKVMSFGTAEAALRSLNKLHRFVPDAIILDISLPGMSGLEAIPHFIGGIEEVPILMLTQSDKEDDVIQALSRGAMGYLLKSATSEEIRAAVRNIASGGNVLDTGVSKYIIEKLKKQPKNEKVDHRLSDRELATLALMAEGLSRKQIAHEFGVSVSTVVTHINRIYRKLDVPNAPAAISKGYRCGILE